MNEIKLNDGTKIPTLGLGTYQLLGKDARASVTYALEAGYRHIDTAKAYNNEEEIGMEISNSSIPRKELFIATKLDNDAHGYSESINALEKSLMRLGMEYVDLYLIHWPSNGKRIETWKAFQDMQEKGLVKSIGVSNFTVDHLQELMDKGNIVPAVNQIEFNPYVYQKDIADFCNKNNITIEAYTPLARAKKFNDQDIKNLSKKYGKTLAQIFLRWSIQHEAVVIPKSKSKERIIENSQIFDFELTEDDMHILNAKHENLRASADPHTIK